MALHRFSNAAIPYKEKPSPFNSSKKEKKKKNPENKNLYNLEDVLYFL